jgi:hypothetical protein
MYIKNDATDFCEVHGTSIYYNQYINNKFNLKFSLSLNI